MAEIGVVLIILVAVVLSHAITKMLPFAIPLPLIQIGFGALIATVGNLGVALDPDIFFLLFIPPLLFLDGWRIPKRGLFKDASTILELAVGLVIFTVLGGGVIHPLVDALSAHLRSVRPGGYPVPDRSGSGLRHYVQDRSPGANDAHSGRRKSS